MKKLHGIDLREKGTTDKARGAHIQLLRRCIEEAMPGLRAFVKRKPSKLHGIDLRARFPATHAVVKQASIQLLRRCIRRSERAAEREDAERADEALGIDRRAIKREFPQHYGEALRLACQGRGAVEIAATLGLTKIVHKGGTQYLGPDDICIDCGAAPRPARTNWGEVPIGVDADSRHHRCHSCYQKWDASRQREDELLRRSHIVGECRETPSVRRIAKSRTAHDCALCERGVDAGESYYQFTVRGPQTVKMCATCAVDIRPELDRRAA